MKYQLTIGNRLYFSWSIAAVMMIEHAGLMELVDITTVYPVHEADVRPRITHLAPARTLPTLTLPCGTQLGDSMAMAEELASRHPDRNMWPEDPKARAIARYLANEMHSSFGALRGSWPVNLRHSYKGLTAPEDVQAELDRLELIWTHARQTTGSQTPWLCGEYSIADAIYAPMATRLTTYGFELGPTSQAYVSAHLSDPALRRLRAAGLAKGAVVQDCERDFERAPWSFVPAQIGTATQDGSQTVNTHCPYSGRPVEHFMRLGDHAYGFCNAMCRDKTMYDPEAWPEFMGIYQS